MAHISKCTFSSPYISIPLQPMAPVETAIKLGIYGSINLAKHSTGARAVQVFWPNATDSKSPPIIPIATPSESNSHNMVILK